MNSIQFLLLQVRNAEDPMREHEVAAFARVLHAGPEQIGVFDLLTTSLTAAHLATADMLLLGGSGDYSAAGEGAWLERALDSLRLVHAGGKPTFASCWGFQALARALGGEVINDVARAEIGTHQLYLTEAGKADPIFAPLGSAFMAQMGHEDHVVELPPNSTLLAYSDRVRNQAYRFDDAPIYATQFHPELTSNDLMTRLRNYPQYISKIAGVTPEQFAATLRDAPGTEGILERFVNLYGS